MFSAVDDDSVGNNVGATDPDEPMDPRRESMRTLDEESGRAATDPDVWNGLRGIPVLTAGVEFERAACEGTEPEVYKGLRGTMLLADGVESERGLWKGVDPEVRRGLRVESRVSFDC